MKNIFSTFRIFIIAFFVMIAPIAATSAQELYTGQLYAANVSHTTRVPVTSPIDVAPTTVTWSVAANRSQDGFVISKDNSSNNVKVTITNSEGTIIYNKDMRRNILQISSRDLSEGKYRVQVQDGQNSTSYLLDIY